MGKVPDYGDTSKLKTIKSKHGDTIVVRPEQRGSLREVLTTSAARVRDETFRPLDKPPLTQPLGHSRLRIQTIRSTGAARSA